MMPIASFLLLALATTGAHAAVPGRELVMQRLGLSRVSIQSLRVDPHQLQIPIDLDGRKVTLTLSPSALRAPGFQVLVRTGEWLREVPPPPAASFRGTVDEIPGSVVGGTIRDRQIRAAIALADGRIFHVQPVSETGSGADPSLHAVYAAGDAIVGEGVCATTGTSEVVPPQSHAESGSGGNASAAAVRTAEIAFDTDHEFYLLNGSSTSNTVADIENVLAQVDAIYERDVQLTHVITTIIVGSSTSDPYSSTDATTLYQQFSDHWNAAHTNVPRDVAHLMTGKSLDGATIGISAVGVICSRKNGYGLTESRFSNNLSRRAALLAHELGHNWNAQHCDGVSPCNIMCSVLNGCDGIGLPNFEPLAINTITSFAASRSCLQSSSGPGPPAQPAALDQFATPAPNPSIGETALSFHLLRSVEVELAIYDVAGHRVTRLAHGVQAAGWTHVPWTGLDEKGNQVQAGVYYARVSAAGATLVQKLVLLR